MNQSQIVFIAGGEIMAEPTAETKQTPVSMNVSQKLDRRSGRRWVTAGAVLLVLLVTGIWFAPTIVAKTSLRQRVPALIFPTYPGAVEVGETSLGWFSPIVVTGLRAEDEEGHPLIEIKEFSTVETLWTLATRQTNLGRMKLVDPVIHVSVRHNGSNLEDVYTKFMSGPASSAPIPAFELEVINARIEFDHKAASQASTIDGVSLLLASTQGGIDQLELSIGPVPASLADDRQTAGTSDWLAVRLGNRPEEGTVATTTDAQHIRLKASGWKLDKLLPALSRLEPNAELSGELNADVKAQLRPDKDSFDWTWDGILSLDQLTLSGIESLHKDTLVLKTLSMGGQLTSQRGRLSMSDVKLTTDVGELQATGEIPLTGLSRASAFSAAQSILGEEDYQIEGHVDLKRLAALVPQTLRIRDETEITGGRLDLKLIGEEKDGSRTWSGGASLSGLTAENRGESVAWTTPLKTSFRAQRRDGQIVVDQLSCQSDFLNVSGGGTLTDAHFTASGDLNRLEQNLERFVDLGLEKIAGRMRADGSIKRESEERASLVAVVQLDDFQWNVSTNEIWREDHLELTAKASVQTDGGTGIQRLNSGELQLTSGSDSLTAKLQDTVDLRSATASVPVAATLTGGLQTWQNRLKPFVVLTDWTLGGNAKIEATVAASSTQVDVEKLAVELDQLQARGPEWLITEPQFKLETSGTWKTNELAWSSPQTTMSSSAVSCRIDKLDVALTSAGGVSRLSGDAAYRADLDKLSRWKNQALEQPAYHLLGILNGRATVTQQADVMSADVDANVEKLVVASLQTPTGQQPRWEALWREPKLHLIGVGSYDSSNDHLKLDESSITADGIGVTAKGTMLQLSSKQQVDVSGDLSYDWEVLVQRFGEMLGKNIHLTGKDQRPFALKGSLAGLAAGSDMKTNAISATTISLGSGPAGVAAENGSGNTLAGLTDLSGHAGLGWESAIVYGLTAGSGNVSAQLAKGICQFAPLDMTVSEGRLHFTPQVRLDLSPALILLPQEKVIDQVRLSPELCSTWLKFVAPMLADAAQIDGKFSMNVADGSLPLMSPTSGELKGALAIHKAQVRPGPSSMQIVNLVEQIRSVIRQRAAADPQRERIWMEMPEQSVDFELSQGRMHHRMLTFQIKDVTLRTSGSVGMDETLNLIAEMTIPDDWVRDKKVLAGLKGKAIRVPIGGTLSRPQPDGRVIGELAKQLGGSALEGLLDDKLDGLLKKKLNKLIP